MAAMFDLDEIAEEAIRHPVAQPTSIARLHDRNDRRRRREIQARVTIAAAVVVFGGFAAMSMAQRRGWSIETEPAAGDPISVDEVFGASLAVDDAIWPDQPIPLDQLLDEFANRVLEWPAIEWDRSGLGDREGGITGTDPTNAGRRVAFQVRQSGDGWQIISLYPPPQIRLTGDELSGFAGIEISPETETIEIYHHDGNTQTLTTQDLDQAGDTTRQHLALPTPVPPDRAGTFLIVGRNHDGQATLVTGIAVGRQTRLTVAIDALIANGTPADPTPLKEALATNPATELDMNAATLLTDLSPDLDLDLYIIPFADRSGVSFYVLDPSGSIAGGGSDSVYFNENGYISYTFNQSEDDGYTIAITPDTIGIDPDIGGTIHPSGHIAILAGNHFAELIVDGDTLRKAN